MTLIILAAAPLLATAQDDAEGKKFPCKLTDYRIVKSDTIMVRCDGAGIKRLAAGAALYKLLDESVVYPSAGGGTGSDADNKNPYWLKFKFDKPLETGQEYELRFSGSYNAVRLGSDQKVEVDPKLTLFKSTRFRFSTSEDLAAVADEARGVQVLAGRRAVVLSPGAKLVDKSNGVEYHLEPGSRDLNDLDTAGLIKLVPETARLGKDVELRGVTDVFGGAAKLVKPPKSAPPAVAPKTKEAAAWHFNVLHQMSEGSGPTWIADVKVAPVLGGLPGGFYFTPSLAVDTGNGQVGETKTNDLINPKFGVSRLVRTHSQFLNGVKFSPALSYETNRKFDKRNILFDGDMKFYFGHLENTKAQRSQDALLKAKLLDPDILPHEVPQAFFGYSIKLFFGTELGTSLTDNEVKSSDKSSTVIVPKYSIRRLRPRFSGAFEFGRFTASLSAYPRFLISDENVTRETDTPQADGTVKKTIALHTVSGWRPYGEFSLSYSFDPAGHYSANSVYKFGSQPPNFDHTNTVLSGVVVRF
jgi:hypothetical protein